jgi:hypothetical protein
VTKFLPVNVGHRFGPVSDPEMARLYRKGHRSYNKLARRMVRGQAMRGRSRIERRLAEARERDYEAQRLASNSHEARRYIELARKERRGCRG